MSVLQPSLLDEIKQLETRLKALERSPRYVAQTIPASPLGLAGIWGMVTTDATTDGQVPNHVFRSDVLLTAPLFSFDMQMFQTSGSAVTSIDWYIHLKNEYGVTLDANIASGSSPHDDQVGGLIDILAITGSQYLNRLVRFDVFIKRVGGSGFVGCRLNRPHQLRTPTE